jgi:hypothetical protein
MVSFPSPCYYCPPSPDKSGARGSLARSTLARATKRCCRCHTAVRATAPRESLSSASRVGAPRAPRTVIQHRAVFSAAHGAGGWGAPRQRRASDRSNGTVTILHCVFNFQNPVWKSWKFAISRAPFFDRLESSRTNFRVAVQPNDRMETGCWQLFFPDGP